MHWPRNCDRAQNESKAVPQARRYCLAERATTSGLERPVSSASLRISTQPGLNRSPPIDEPSSKIAPAVAGWKPPARSKGSRIGPSKTAVPVWLTIVVFTR